MHSTSVQIHTALSTSIASVWTMPDHNKAILDYLELVDRYVELRDELNRQMGDGYLGLARCRYNGIDMSSDRYLVAFEPVCTFTLGEDGVKRYVDAVEGMEKLKLSKDEEKPNIVRSQPVKTNKVKAFATSFESWPSQELKKTRKSFEKVVDLALEVVALVRRMEEAEQVVLDGRNVKDTSDVEDATTQAADG